MLNVDLACEPYGNAIDMIRSFIGTFTRNTHSEIADDVEQTCRNKINKNRPHFYLFIGLFVGGVKITQVLIRLMPALTKVKKR